MPFNAPRGLKQELEEGRVKIGMFLGSSSVQLAEVVAFQEIDFLLVDLEHGELNDTRSATELIRVGDVAHKPVIVRVPTNSVETIGQVLDAGAVGVCIPHVRNRRDAEAAVSYAKYAPEGVRAMSPLVRATRYSAADWDASWRTANEEVIVMAIVEDEEGVGNLEEIASVPGLDVIWVGIGDLSQDLGFYGELDHPDVLAAVERGLQVAIDQGKTAFTGLGGLSADGNLREEMNSAVSAGFRMFAWVDTVLVAAVLRGALTQVSGARGEE
jgi:4-hydroxy-2-oxoheptanedioate aldolase